ncbi:putative MPP superfamily phosphohydrolase [Brevibacterium sanguinis]|uniref:MPP superfamily phosphohydrolase n=2 Tax=Brevibacterium TaxID=1696 RepID=A0ABX9GMC1_9MICO|nr:MULTISPECIES: metallophosphoesterase [Brevibacterium]RBP63410.1 putative MPP superfamily phosphohydrolase [Brevibacterium sanguinis]RBP69877.1 putative MPP superfamily phosphohydrolase [Brevibacterium celere]
MKKRALAAAALALPASAGLWSAVVEPHLFAIRRHTLPVLPAGHESIRVLHVSDLHLAPWQRHRARWVSALTRLEPDVVVNTGDNLTADIVPEVLDVFTGLLDVPGVFVLGSNDFFSPKPKNPAAYLTSPSAAGHRTEPDLDVDALVRGFEDGGWHLLDNAEASLTIRGTRIDFCGLGDAHIDRDRIRVTDELEYPRFDGDADLRIGVTHAPYSRTLEAFASAGADLIMAGHTHGGQIRVPFWGAPVTNCDLDRTRARGVFPYRQSLVAVSAGLGFSRYSPVRFACRPEVGLLTLVPHGR